MSPPQPPSVLWLLCTNVLATLLLLLVPFVLVVGCAPHTPAGDTAARSPFREGVSNKERIVREGFSPAHDSGGAGGVGGAALHEGLKIGSLKKAGKQMDPTKEVKKLFAPIERTFTQMADRMARIDDQLAAIPKTLQRELRETERRTTDGMNAVVKKVTRAVDKVVDKLERFVQFVVDIALAVGSYLRCGVEKITRLPRCWYYYALEMLGKLLYLPVSAVFWLTGTRDVEDAMWAALEALDAAFSRTVFSSAIRAREGTTAATSVPTAFALILFAVLGIEWDYTCPADPWWGGASPPHPPGEDAANGGGGGGGASLPDFSGYHLLHFPDQVVDECYLCGGGGGGGGGNRGLRAFPNPKDYF